MKAKIISEALGDVLKPIDPEVEKYMRKLKFLYDRLNQDPYALVKAMLEAGADPLIFARIFVKTAPREYLEEYIIDSLDPYDDDKVLNMMEYLDIEEDLFSVLAGYAKNENDEEFKTIVNDMDKKLGEDLEKKLKQL